eukprot:1667728-Pleurochrysis_carterae.AAC.2
MFVMHIRRQRLCEYVGHVVVRSYFAHLNVALCDVLAHLQVAPINMSRALTKASLFRELDCPRVVHVHRGGLRLFAPHFCEQALEIYHFSGSVRGGYNFCFGGRQRDAMLTLRTIGHCGSAVHDAKARRRVSDGPITVGVGEELPSSLRLVLDALFGVLHHVGQHAIRMVILGFRWER